MLRVTHLEQVLTTVVVSANGTPTVNHVSGSGAGYAIGEQSQFLIHHLVEVVVPMLFLQLPPLQVV